MAELAPLFMDINNVYSGDELGLPYRDLIGEGIVGATDLAVTQRAAGANLSVDVAAGACWVLGDTNTARQPCYRCANDAVVNKGITPDPSNPRKVIVFAQIFDDAFTGAGKSWGIATLHGTPAASPVEPTLPPSCLPLALIDVTAGDTDITNAQITDRRTPAALGGGQLGRWMSYTPTITGSGTNPTLGTGSNRLGRYVQTGKTVTAEMFVAMGTTGFSNGTGNIIIGLPVAANTSFSQVSSIASGVGSFTDASVPGVYILQAELNDANSVHFRFQGAGTLLTFTVPVTIAQSDEVRVFATYEAA